VSAKQAASGTILVEPTVSKSSRCIIYARVSSYEKKDDLKRQAERCSEFCRVKGWVIDAVVTEVGSGMNDSRRKLQKILHDPPTILVVEHKDRLTRFGFAYMETLLPKLGCELVVIHRDEEEQSDLMKDLISVITSFCCRLYGMRRGYKKAKEVFKCVAP
jgi:predicted site-specific integrase-resolvase